MANHYPKSDRGLYFDEFNPGPYTLYGGNLFAKRYWDCEKLLSVSTKDIESAGVKPEEYRTLVLGKGIQEIKSGVIELFPNLQDLITDSDLRKLGCTPEAEALLARREAGGEAGPALHPQEHLPVPLLRRGPRPEHGTHPVFPVPGAAFHLAGRQMHGHLRRQHRRRDRSHRPRRGLLRGL